MEPQPEATDQSVAGAPAPLGATSAAEQASAMGNQAFGRALEAARGAGETQVARLGALDTVAAQAAQGAASLGGQRPGVGDSALEGAVTGAQPTADAAIDKAALASRVAGIAQSALTSWAATATIIGVTINGPVGSGGTLIGAPLTAFMQSAGAAPPAEAAVQAKALQGFAEAFQQWCGLFKLPGLPLWPSFAAIPMPVAPPTLGIPMPLVAVASAPLMLTLVGSNPSEQEALDAAGAAMRGGFEVWKVGRMVTGLMGSGPVPSFAPPFIPVGPVVGGTGFAPPPAII